MILTSKDIYQLWTEDRSRPESALRIRLANFPYRQDGQRSAPLCFPLSDSETLTKLFTGSREGSEELESVEIAIVQAVTRFNRERGDWTLRLLACRVVNDEFEAQYQRTRLDGFITSGSMCTTESRCDLTWQGRTGSVRYSVTPGRVGVYATYSGTARYGDEHLKDPLRPLTGWVEDHPRNDSMKRLAAVSELKDLHFFVTQEAKAKEAEAGHD